MILTSLKNPRVIYVRKLLNDAGLRKETGCFVLEHKSAIAELIQKYPYQIEALYTTEFQRYTSRNYPVFEVSPHVMEGMTGLKTHQAILAVVKKKSWEYAAVLQNARTIVILDHIQSPGNVGAIIRNAAAFKANAVLCIGSADPYHPEALRGMGGHCFQVPFWSCSLDEAVEVCQNFSVWGLESKGTHEISTLSEINRHAFVLGSEGQGISQELKKAFPTIQTLRISMSDEVESLNVAVSSGIVLYNLFKIRKD